MTEKKGESSTLGGLFDFRNASLVDICVVVLGPVLFAMNLASSWSFLKYTAGSGGAGRAMGWGGVGGIGEGIYPLPIVSLRNVQVDGDEFVDVKECAEGDVLGEMQERLDLMRETLIASGRLGIGGGGGFGVGSSSTETSLTLDGVKSHLDRLGETQLYSCDDLEGFLDRLAFFLLHFHLRPLDDVHGNLKVPTTATFIDFFQNNLYHSKRACAYDASWLDKFHIRVPASYNDFTSFLLYATARVCHFSDPTVTMEKPVVVHTSITEATAPKNIVPFVSGMPEWVSVRVAVEEGPRLSVVTKALAEQCEAFCQLRWKCDDVHVAVIVVPPIAATIKRSPAAATPTMTMLKWLAYDPYVRKTGESISVMVQEGADIDSAILRTAVANYRPENVVTGSGIFFARSETNAANVQTEYLAHSSHALKTPTAYFGSNLKVSALEASSVVILDSHHLKTVATSSMFSNLVAGAVPDCTFAEGGLEAILDQVISTVVRTMGLVIVSDPGLQAMVKDTLPLQARGGATASSASSSPSFLSFTSNSDRMLCSSPLLLGPKKSALLLLPDAVLRPTKKLKGMTVLYPSSMVHGLRAFGNTRISRPEPQPHDGKFFVVDAAVDIVYTIGPDHLLLDGVDLKFTSECTIYAFGGQDLHMAVFYVHGRYYIQTNVTSVVRFRGGDGDGSEQEPRTCTTLQLQVFAFPEGVLSSPLLPFLPVEVDAAALARIERKIVKMSQVAVTHLLE